ncbi:MAG: metal-dependent phosphoesterase PHP family [Halothiobacillaceae bacterium]|nr:MAG: metal-dependent phosphoesterase PHP family [Halothiobacillaceae bacterium]
MLNFDLHSHSTASDGSLSPTALIHRAKQQGVDVLALTDHDTLAGLAEAARAAQEVGLTLLPGVEISTSWEGRTLHIVGLGIDPHNRALQEGLEGLQTIRRQRAMEMGARLEKAGIPDAYAGAQRLAQDDNITRTHFAQYLVEMGKARSISDVFNRYMVSGKPGYVKTEWAPLSDAVAWINQAGGVAVIAHPDRYQLEVVYSGCSRDITLRNRGFAKKYNLAGSRGSDFHTPGYSWVELGKLPPLPQELLPIWEHPRFPQQLLAHLAVGGV